MKLTTGLPVERFLQILEIVAREGKQLSYVMRVKPLNHPLLPCSYEISALKDI